MVNLVAVAIGSVVLAVVVLRSSLRRVSHESKEPPTVPSTIPFIGHLLGIMRHNNYYYTKLSKRTNASIFAVPMLGKSTYIATSLSSIAAAQRNTKALAFEPLVANVSQRVSGCSKESGEKIQFNLDGSQGDRGYVMTFFKNIHPTLAPGKSLNAMNRIMIQNVADSVDALSTKLPERIKLGRWLRHEITLATSNSVYGPLNPLVDRNVEDAFWTYDENLMSLIVNVLPNITARKGVKARADLKTAFQYYFERKGHLKGSALVQARYNHSCDYGVPIPDIASFEAGGCLATLTNTFPTAYWMLAYIYSHDEVLNDCREELSTITTSTIAEDGTTQYCIDMTSIKSSCPVISATLQEVLRHTSVGASVREVTENIVIDGFHLKKGNMFIMPSNIIHSDRQAWGENVEEFDHRRFLKDSGRKRPNPSAFRAFGGGSTLCPGRHFAATEILAVATMFIARFDMKSVGPWPQPRLGSAPPWAQIVQPDLDFEVEVSPRKDLFGKAEWGFQLSESQILLAMAAEDMPNESKGMY